MRAVAAAIVVAASASEAPQTNLALTWKDCGGAVPVQSVTPSTVPLGTSTVITGTTASAPGTVSTGTFAATIKAGWIPLASCSGPLGPAKTCTLPLGAGSLTLDAIPMPIKPGPVSISLKVNLAASLPAQLASTTTHATATSGGTELVCLDIMLNNAAQQTDIVARIQNTPGVLWTAGINPRFMNDELKPLMGVTREGMAERLTFASQYNNTASTLLPDRFESEEHWPHCAKVIGDIRDQSNCGCCWAFAGVSAASDRLCIATKGATLHPLSAQDMCFCTSSDGCDGGDITSPWIHINWNHRFGGQGVVTGGQYQGTGPFGPGMCSDFSLPHCHHHGPIRSGEPYPPENAPGCPHATSPQCPTSCDSSAKAPHKNFKMDKIGFTGNILKVSGHHGIASAIMEGGPVETAFDVYADFANYVSGIYHHVTGGFMGGHAVRFVGWGQENGQKYWKVANSWNPWWGEKGYFRIKRGNNECSIEDMVTGAAADAIWGPHPNLLDKVVV